MESYVIIPNYIVSYVSSVKDIDNSVRNVEILQVLVDKLILSIESGSLEISKEVSNIMAFIYKCLQKKKDKFIVDYCQIVNKGKTFFIFDIYPENCIVFESNTISLN